MRTRQRELGQNFLADPNLLDVIERLAELKPSDVALEVGGGRGVLSERLVSRCAHVHVVEVDRPLVEELERRFGSSRAATVHCADALDLDLHALDPQPNKVVANLPYGIAATIILKTIQELRGVSTWVVMVQREVGERFAAAPGTGAYGVPSVLAQLACEVKILRPVSRNVFRPAPNVDSVLLGLQRREEAATPELKRLVHAAFAHRRKTLAGSLALAPGASREVRGRAQHALAQLGHPTDQRAERLTPQEFAALSRLL